ncbi:MAG: exosortase/archaeosortase family protein, partial [bacterium]
MKVKVTYPHFLNPALRWDKIMASNLLMGLFIALYFQVVVVLLQQWKEDPNYSHGFLVPLVSGYFVWNKRKALKSLPRRTHFVGLLLLIAGLAIYVIGVAGAELFSMRISMIVVLGGLIYYLFGKQMLKEIWFPLAFLAFMIPVPYVIYYAATFPLQILSTKLTNILLNIVGIAALRQGNIIYMQNYSLEVIEACSGLRSLMTLSALG